MKLGRQHVFAGFAHDSLDSWSGQAPLGANFAVSFYGGSPVALENVRFNWSRKMSGKMKFAGGWLLAHVTEAREDVDSCNGCHAIDFAGDTLLPGDVC